MVIAFSEKGLHLNRAIGHNGLRIKKELHHGISPSFLANQNKPDGVEEPHRHDAMHLNYTPKGKMTDRLVDFYSLRARGGVGLLMIGACRVSVHAGPASMHGIHDDRFLSGLER
jgi:hypothetical protein